MRHSRWIPILPGCPIRGIHDADCYVSVAHIRSHAPISRVYISMNNGSANCSHSRRCSSEYSYFLRISNILYYIVCFNCSRVYCFTKHFPLYSNILVYIFSYFNRVDKNDSVIFQTLIHQFCFQLNSQVNKSI